MIYSRALRMLQTRAKILLHKYARYDRNETTFHSSKENNLDETPPLFAFVIIYLYSLSFTPVLCFSGENI